VLLLPPPRSPLFPYTTLFRSPPRDLVLLAPELLHLLLLFHHLALRQPRPEDLHRRIAVRVLRPLRLALNDDPRGDVRDSHGGARSEEHTSELQSRENLVCRLL